ncbi:PREDICTED: probable phospholipid-transporting ATPase VD isoform X1 [Hipposideros armiger]|uniref:Phospholipid-transporting ATPase n=1 Tax=Hipposideros armiger TaxID=186990 RepID=A0A8B7TBK6_HIPAR|nr:PREDICTED: probable phospholipid-transporting ATPase VD isoform X1 [Hipposideros armiger]XP_019521308.1 PREDICTED: probable phospholipid-transporting ATPase VD isoform X1 [Hipposideros armiger]XP_019521309.1 PREDICTED: probable phospholipid-transporting ATPase VD isoform X1 [Hipposideros armiger]XP_019521310.1 PREDICTED: probable phospholipid-transporting ATPase VD isoform X1 [Hipposideros armiger]XP_019521311.1 PREDICTED: probable phospholipid-transporting ATPase VD isoform X1 [Hipposideros
MTEPLQWARYHWQRLMGGTNRDDDERPYNYSSLLTCGAKSSQTPKLAGKHRVVVPHLQPFKEEYDKFSGTYVNNRIRTTKYTLLNFVPRNLFEQFHRAANLYFLFLVVLNWVPLVEAFQKEITMLPLVVVLTIIAIKDGLEDYRKYKIDKQINNLVTKVYSRKEKKYIDRCWKDVTVGDFIRLSCNEVIPADMVLLFSTDPDGICHIETSGLDGESNLKQRQVVRGYGEQDSEVDPEKFSSRIECESPNNDLNRFRGFLEHPNKERVGLSKENLLLRGCTIRNTEAVVGIVVYAGHETKAMLNNSGPRYKRSKLERRANTDVLWCVLLLAVMCLTGALGHGIWLSRYQNILFFNIPEADGHVLSPVVAGFYMFWTMIILLQVLIPISLYVSIEIVKLGQIYFIQSDVDFYNEKMDSTVQCRALNITEDLGQIQYLFSDKTGTLTENKMVFRRCSVAGFDYCHEENAKRLESYQEAISEDEEFADTPSDSLSNMAKLKAPSCRTVHNGPLGSKPSNHLAGSCSALGSGDGASEVLHSRQAAFSSPIETDVVPDTRLLNKFSQITPQLFNSPDETIPNPPLETLYIIDFFIALAICNTVVVSAPNQPRQKIRLSTLSGLPTKSLEEIKNLFQRLSVRRSSSPSLASGKEPSSGVPSAFVSRLSLFSRMKLSSSVEEACSQTGESPPGSSNSACPTDTEKQNGDAGVTKAKVDSLPGQPLASNLCYEAESPDEAALVYAARAYQCTLQSRTPEQVVVDFAALGPLTFQLLHILPFDSVRKRMSVVVRHPLSNQVVVYTKGADSVIMELLSVASPDGASLEKQQMIIREKTQKHLDDYAKRGLRTLCIAKKVMSDTEYAEWLRNHFLAETSIDNREELLLESAMRLENKLTLLGATGIEDRLQEGVPESIEALHKAGIKIWMLTGDKQETAVNIAYACKLLEPDDKLFILNTQSKDACETRMGTILKELQKKNPASPEQESLNEALSQPPAPEDAGQRAGLVITGKTLEFALQESLQRQFLELTACCYAVVCCRATPLQKSKVVKLVRNQLRVMTLAIGDGANDVSMIQVADIGIGISGQEGMQAVMASDFAVSQFKHLSKLLLVHGHWCYTRLSNMILYFFYKNVAYVNLLFWYQFFCGFSGTSMTDYWVLIFFNLLFTSAPPVIYGVLEKDVSAETLMQLPELYKSGQKSEAYLPLTFWVTLLDAFYQSLACFFVPYYTYQGSDIDIFTFGNPLNTAALFIILLHLVIESKSLTWIHILVIVGSILSYVFFTLAFGAMCVTCNPPSNPYWIMQEHMLDPVFYLVCVLTTFVALLPRFMYRVLQGSLFPSPILRAKHFDRLTSEERIEALKKWRGTGRMGQVTTKCADHSAAKSARRPMSGPSDVFAMMSATSCAVEQGNLTICETVLDSDYSETKTSKC